MHSVVSTKQFSDRDLLYAANRVNLLVVEEMRGTKY